MRRVLPILLFIVFGLGIAAVIAAPRKEPNPNYMVRVAIVREAREVQLFIDGKYRLVDGDTRAPAASGTRLPPATVRLIDKGILVGINVYPYKRLLVHPLNDATVTINNHRFRGDVMILRTANNRITVVNTINIEDYIKGVLYHEVSHHWPMEALKAQAVATRTYAIYSINGKDKPYDVTNDIYSQVYGGRNSERYRTGLAVERTKGEVLTYNNGKMLPAYFHASCGGMTEDASNLWKIDAAPLKGVPCLFCQDSPHNHWKRNFRLKEIQDALNARGHKIGLIKDIAVVDRNRSGRINTLRITARDGQELTITGIAFRDAIGPNQLKSNNYEIDMQGYYVNFIGKGWGHGVGMCQWGAKGMADQQFTYQQILKYYYPGAVLTDYHELR